MLFVAVTPDLATAIQQALEVAFDPYNSTAPRRWMAILIQVYLNAGLAIPSEASSRAVQKLLVRGSWGRAPPLLLVSIQP